MLRILHTADWHLGARLIEGDRLPEQGAFLEWFLTQVTELRPHLLIVAGDIFDTSTPPQEALQLYYRFLARLAVQAPCRVLILGGNHDSPATLHAPREILESLQIRVIASPTATPEEALLEFPEALVCAVPFLRERDVRKSTPGQSPDEIASEIRDGIRAHYQALRETATARADGRLLIGTGHLTAVGVQHSQSERDIHIGNLGAVSADCFQGFAYTALGHIHRPQAVDAAGTVRYAGSPIPLSFSEVDLAKEFRVLDIQDGRLEQRSVAIPVFRPVLRLKLLTSELKDSLTAQQASSGQGFIPWLELTVTDGYQHPDLDRQVRDAAKELRLEVLKVLAPPPVVSGPVETPSVIPSLEELSPEEVFAKRLQHHHIAADSEDAKELTLSFKQLMESMQ